MHTPKNYNTPIIRDIVLEWILWYLLIAFIIHVNYLKCMNIIVRLWPFKQRVLSLDLLISKLYLFY